MLPTLNPEGLSGVGLVAQLGLSSRSFGKFSLVTPVSMLVGFTREDQKRFILRLPPKARHRAIIGTGVHVTLDAEERLAPLRITGEVLLDIRIVYEPDFSHRPVRFKEGWYGVPGSHAGSLGNLRIDGRARPYRLCMAPSAGIQIEAWAQSIPHGFHFVERRNSMIGEEILLARRHPRVRRAGRARAHARIHLCGQSTAVKTNNNPDFMFRHSWL